MSTIDITFKGLPELQRRLTAIGQTNTVMRDLALTAIGNQKRKAVVKTGNMRRQIHLGRVTKTSAETIAGANYSGAVEFGTKPHEIRPRARKALRWKAKGGAVVFARVVHHPGTKARPFMIPGAEDALRSVALRDKIIIKWNRAA